MSYFLVRAAESEERKRKVFFQFCQFYSVGLTKISYFCACSRYGSRESVVRQLT